MESLKGKKLLILAGAAVHCKVVEAAKALGVYTIVTDYLVDSPAKALADESWMLNITDVDGIVAKCREENVDGVLNFCIDPAQRPYVQICEKLGLPCYGNAEQVHIMTDKPAFKAFCQKHGVDIIPTYTQQDVAENKIEYPVLVKPVDSRGSRGLTICTRAEELDGAIAFAANESSNGQAIIEKYMGGKQDFSMTYFVINGVPYLVRTGDRYLGKKEDKLDKQCIGSISPSKHSDMYIRHIHPKMVKLIADLGIIYGPLFMQGFIDGDTVRMYDPGLRFPGTEYEKLFYQATGANLMQMMVELALTGRVTNAFGDLTDGYLLCGGHSVQMLISARTGKIVTFEGLDEIKKDPRVVTASPRYRIGEVVPDSGDVKQRVCEIVLLIRAEDDIKLAVDFIWSKLKVLDEVGESMLVSPITAEQLL